MSHEQKCSFNNHEIIFLNAAELYTLMPVLGTGKFNFRDNFISTHNVVFVIGNSHKSLQHTRGIQ